MVTASQALAAVRLTARELSPPSPRRALAMAASIISILAFARIACSVLEAYSQVRGERLADAELMQMCTESRPSPLLLQSGGARGLPLRIGRRLHAYPAALGRGLALDPVQ